MSTEAWERIEALIAGGFVGTTQGSRQVWQAAAAVDAAESLRRIAFALETLVLQGEARRSETWNDGGGTT